MGKAFDILSAEERLAIALDLLEPMRPGHPEAVDRSTARLWARCPFHAEKTPGGAFYYAYGEDVAYCWSCGAGADLIELYAELNGLGKQDGYKAFAEKYFSGRSRDDLRSRPAAPVNAARWEPAEPAMPCGLWSEKAEKFATACARTLQEDPEALAEIKARGITPETASLCGLGWNPRKTFRPVTSWGLPYEKNERGRERKICLPKGLVLPFRAGNDRRIVQMKIRDADPREGEEKYKYIRNGVRPRYFLFGRHDLRAWVIVETERDGFLLWQELRGLGVGVMATGSVSIRPDAVAFDILRRADVILNALDSDGPGAKQARGWWADQFPNQKRWLVPTRYGKDAGDAHCAGLSLRAWVWAGLPNHVRLCLENTCRDGAVQVWKELPPPPLPTNDDELQIEEAYQGLNYLCMEGLVSLSKPRGGMVRLQYPTASPDPDLVSYAQTLLIMSRDLLERMLP